MMWFFKLFWGNISAVIWRVCFGLQFLFSGPNYLDFLTDLMKQKQKNVEMVVSQVMSKLFFFFLLFTRACHVFPLICLLYLDCSTLRVHFLASEMFYHIFLFWDHTIIPDLCVLYRVCFIYHRQFWNGSPIWTIVTLYSVF